MNCHVFAGSKENNPFFRVLRMTRVLTPTKRVEKIIHNFLPRIQSIRVKKKSTLKKGWVERLLKNYIQYLPFEMISFQGQHWKNMCKNSTSRLVGELFFASGVVPPESQLKKLHAEFLLILRGGVAGCFFDKCPSFQYLESRSTP